MVQNLVERTKQALVQGILQTPFFLTEHNIQRNRDLIKGQYLLGTFGDEEMNQVTRYYIASMAKTDLNANRNRIKNGCYSKLYYPNQVAYTLVHSPEELTDELLGHFKNDKESIIKDHYQERTFDLAKEKLFGFIKN